MSLYPSRCEIIEEGQLFALGKIFKPQAEGIKAWKAGDTLLESFQKQEVRVGELLQEAQNLASEIGVGLMKVDSHYEFHFADKDNLPQDWYASRASNGVTYFKPKEGNEGGNAAKASRRLRAINEDFAFSSPAGNVKYAIYEDARSRNLPVMEMMALVPRDENAIKYVEKLGDDYYIVTTAEVQQIPGCAEIKLSDYYGLKENLPTARNPQNTPQPK